MRPRREDSAISHPMDLIATENPGRSAATSGVATRKRPPILTADNQMTPKPNLALNAEIVRSGRAANCATTTARDPEIIDPITVECVKWLERNTETLRSGAAWDKRSREQPRDRDRWEHSAKEEPLEGAPGRRRAHQGRAHRIRPQVPRLRLVNAQTPMQSITEGSRDGREHANKPRNAQVGIAGSTLSMDGNVDKRCAMLKTPMISMAGVGDTLRTSA